MEFPACDTTTIVTVALLPLAKVMYLEVHTTPLTVTRASVLAALKLSVTEPVLTGSVTVYFNVLATKTGVSGDRLELVVSEASLAFVDFARVILTV